MTVVFFHNVLGPLFVFSQHRLFSRSAPSAAKEYDFSYTGKKKKIIGEKDYFQFLDVYVSGDYVSIPTCKPNSHNEHFSLSFIFGRVSYRTVQFFSRTFYSIKNS